MFHLFFGSVISIITTVVVLAMVLFTVIVFLKRGDIGKWGRLILVFIVVGTAISALSATRDYFMMENALFEVSSIQALICSVAGGLIFLTGLMSLFVRNQKFRRMSFHLISVFFIVQVLTIEVSRVTLL